MDDTLRNLRQAAGQTFDFRNSLWGQFGLMLLFGFALVGFQTVLVHLKPPRWLLWVYVGLGFAVLLPFIATFLLTMDVVFALPYSVRAPITVVPFSHAGISAAVLIWTGISHMFRRDA